MSIRASSNRGFTLLEVMVATAVVALLTFGLFRFVNANLTALKISTELHDENQAMQSFISFLQTQLNNVPPRRAGALSGAPFKFHELSSDEMTWLCSAGHGVLTDAAPESYRVTLALQPALKEPDVLELGLRREVVVSEGAQPLDASFFTRGSGAQKYHWLPLLRGIAALKIRYFDQRLNAPVERWNDPNVRPSLVTVSVWRHAEDPPYEAVLEVPASRLVANAIQSGDGAQPGADGKPQDGSPTRRGIPRAQQPSPRPPGAKR